MEIDIEIIKDLKIQIRRDRKAVKLSVSDKLRNDFFKERLSNCIFSLDLIQKYLK